MLSISFFPFSSPSSSLMSYWVQHFWNKYMNMRRRTFKSNKCWLCSKFNSITLRQYLWLSCSADSAHMVDVSLVHSSLLPLVLRLVMFMAEPKLVLGLMLPFLALLWALLTWGFVNEEADVVADLTLPRFFKNKSLAKVVYFRDLF